MLFILGNALLGYNASHAISGWLVSLLGLNEGATVGEGDFILRKIAHVLEYAVLGILVTMLCVLLKKNQKRMCVWFSLFFFLSVGVLDEFFQSFSSRTSAVSDVLLDFGAAVVGMAMVHGVSKMMQIAKKNKSVQEEI